MNNTYWKTIEYIGGGYVLQRRMTVDRDGEDPSFKYFDDTLDDWVDHSANNITDIKLPERVIHIEDAENIDSERILNREIGNEYKDDE